MRTAIIIGKTHSGEWKLLSHPDENMIEQRKKFRELRVHKASETFAIIQYQESDGHAEQIRFLTHDAHKAREDQKAADMAAYKASVAKEKPMASSAGQKPEDHKEPPQQPEGSEPEQEESAPEEKPPAQVPQKPKHVPQKGRR